jgi:TetR/AcrR family transcriptional repressor of lmrAB and yxaGH operons
MRIMPAGFIARLDAGSCRVPDDLEFRGTGDGSKNLVNTAHDGVLEPKKFLQAYCKVMAGWMAESGFRSGCPIATTLLENARQSPTITAAGRRAIDGWIDIVAGVLSNGGMPRSEARNQAQLIIAAMEGALILSRIRRSTRPILDVAKAL